MDGSSYVFNLAGDGDKTDPKLALVPREMTHRASDGQNLICSADAFFDPKSRQCTRYPFTNDASMIVTATNNEEIELSVVTESIMLLRND